MNIQILATVILHKLFSPRYSHSTQTIFSSLQLFYTSYFSPRERHNIKVSILSLTLYVNIIKPPNSVCGDVSIQELVNLCSVCIKSRHDHQISCKNESKQILIA